MEEPRRLGGRYELGSVLGRGGMAEVYLAHDTRLGRTVAVKTLRADLARDPSFQARFRREAQSAASLNHPAIVAVYDTGEDYVDGVSIPYIVMEYVDGSTLRELLHSGRKLLPERSLEMTIGILQALEYSHRDGIVHRDIKPANVMLTRTGQVKVMDFGIARAMGDSGMTMTQTAAVIGTAQYLSPEQAKGEQVDARSDLYSTGCLLYELLTVRPPFVGDSPVAVAYQHVREEPQPPSDFDPEITPEMDAIVLKALVKDPDYRYQSADEMRADIEACLDGQPVAATAAMGAVGYGGYPDDQPTTALRAAGPGGPDLDAAADEPGRRRLRLRRPPATGAGGQKKSNTSTILLVARGRPGPGRRDLHRQGAVQRQQRRAATPCRCPNLVGKTLEEAKELAAQRRPSRSTEGGSKPCDNVKKGQVTCARTRQPAAEIDKDEHRHGHAVAGAAEGRGPERQGRSRSRRRPTSSRRQGLRQGQDRAEGVRPKTPGTVLDQDPRRAERGDEEHRDHPHHRQGVRSGTSRTSSASLRRGQEAAEGTTASRSASTEQEVTDPNQVGKVLDQSPPRQHRRPRRLHGDSQVGKAGGSRHRSRMWSARTLEGSEAGCSQQAGFTNLQLAGGSSQDDNARVITQDPAAEHSVGPQGRPP